MKEYKDRVKRDFAEAPLHRFMQQLRNHTLHYRLPPTRAINSFRRRDDGGHEFDNAFWLDVERLREWDDWTGKAREYLEALGDKVKLDDIMDAYEPIVAGFHGWLSARIREEHAEAIEETFELERRMQAVELRAYGDRADDDAGRPAAQEDPERGLVLGSLLGPSGRGAGNALATPDDVVWSLYEALSYPHGGLPDLATSSAPCSCRAPSSSRSGTTAPSWRTWTATSGGTIGR